MTLKIDNFDRKILFALQENASISLHDIGVIVGLSSTPCCRRIKRLEKNGVIQKRIVRLSPKKLGLNFEAFVDVTLGERNQILSMSLKCW